MVFTSPPLYFETPNWQQQENPQQRSEGDLVPPASILPTVAGCSGSVRPGSMADRARLAKVPQPETALKCPRCESTNTKFCYFNNYSLSQPRHFCKTCRRYWTRGGALRNVPVGGGCRRNKRSKASGLKSPASSECQVCPTSATSLTHSTGPQDLLAQIPPLPPLHLPLMAGLPQFSDYGGADIALNFGGAHSALAGATEGGGGIDMDFHVGSSSSCTAEALITTGEAEPWRLQQVQQFPFLTGLEPTSEFYPYHRDTYDNAATGQLRELPPNSGISQISTLKAETQGFQLCLPGSDQYWNPSAWPGLSSFPPPSSNRTL